MVDMYIDEVYPKGECYPLIAHFQNGYPSDNFADQECTILENKISNKKWLASEINDILYTGEECEENLGQTFILARNRTTGKVRLIEAGTIELQPMMKSKLEKSELETSYIDLGRKFGSKRHKKVLEQNERLKINEEVVMEQLKDVSQNVSIDQLDLSSYNKSDAEEFYIPPINREAHKLEDVYMLSAILSPQQYDTIFTELDNTDYKSGLFPYVKDIFSSDWSKQETVIAVYVSTLLSLICKTMKEIGAKKFVACPYSPTLDKVILQQFFTYKGTSRFRPAPYKDKTICYAIVLLFLINNYKIDVASFCKSCRLVEKTASTKISMTGGWLTKQGTKKIAVLKLPLNKASLAYSKKRINKTL